MSEWFIDKAKATEFFEGKTVAVVCSGPGCAENAPGLVDSAQIVVRVNNWRIQPPGSGSRCDVAYSFWGGSQRMTKEELQAAGVKMLMSKCPNAKILESSPWHEAHGKPEGIDFRPIYRRRADWWFAPTYVTPLEDFMALFHELGDHIPTTGWTCLRTILALNPKSVLLTGMDGFTSGLHECGKAWVRKNTDDPIGHVPEKEIAWIKNNIDKYPLMVDARLARAIA